jgi:DNA-binding IclR family transcriptional regulator
VSEISRELGLHKTTVVRLLRTLVNMHLARKDEVDDCYAWEPITWAGVLHTVRRLVSPMDRIMEVLSDLAEETGATSLVGHPDPSGRRMGIALRALPDTAVHVDPGPFRRPPMHCTSAGKAYLAYASASRLKAYMEAGLPALTPHTITSADRLRSDLARARSRGYATTLEECLEDTAGIGVPILDNSGHPVAGLQLCIPREQALPGNFERWAPLLSAASDRLTEVLYGHDASQDAAGLGIPTPDALPSRPRSQGAKGDTRRPHRVV